MQVLFAFTAMNCFYTNNEKYNPEIMIIARTEMEKEFTLTMTSINCVCFQCMLV